MNKPAPRGGLYATYRQSPQSVPTVATPKEPPVDTTPFGSPATPAQEEIAAKILESIPTVKPATEIKHPAVSGVVSRAKRWRQAHPEQWKAIHAASMKRYRAKKRAQKLSQSESDA